MDTLKLNETISFYRKKQGLTQGELAQALGVTNQSVSKWESGQCCPDITLIPQLADIFGISLDELFGKKANKNGAHVVPFADDDVYRVMVTQGNRIYSIHEDLNKHICLRFPENCNATTRQYFKVEVLGNLYCDASINGDVIGHGTIECHDINGDVRECHNNIICSGDINGNANAGDSLTCGGSISGAVACGDNVDCGGTINGSVNCGDNVSCGGNIMGSVTCGGKVECCQIGGNVECQGDIIYKN